MTATHHDRQDPAIAHPQMEQLLQFQRDALEMITLNRPTNEILNGLCLLAEAMVDDSVASIMLLDQSHSHLEVRAAPSIPHEAIEALNGLQPGPDAGSCGTAVFKREPVFVANILTDARWARFMDVAKRFNMQACWSMPIRVADDDVVGSFALTSFQTRPPDPFHRRLLDTGSYLAGIVLERDRQAQRLLTAGIAFEHMREGVMVTDARHRIVQVNQAFERITGYRAEEAIGETPRLLNSGHQDADFYRGFYHSLAQRGEWLGEIWNRRKNGDVYPQWLSVKAVRGPDGSACQHVSVFADITDTKDSERKLWQMAHHDALSDLPNRLLLNARLEHAVQRAHRTDTSIGVMFIDLDRFKNINDTLGHQVGDELLQEVARRLRSSVKEDDTVARLGGDEFVVVTEGIADANCARLIAQRIIERLSIPVTISGKTLFATASIGISLYPQDATAPETLLQHADAAMYQAKALGRNRLAFYAPELTHAIQQRLDMEHDLRRGLSNQEFLLHYQPQFDATDGRLVAVEALLRWQHPKRGMVPPNEFIPVAEETGMIIELGAWVTETACTQAKVWRDAGHCDFILAVNLSPYQLRTDCTTRLKEIFRDSGFPAEFFEFEVTETLLVGDDGSSLQQLADIRTELGLRIAMDDFGTGHSSLSQLKLLPIGKLKIDRSFINDLPDDQNDAAIVKAIILMAHTLGLEVVAEGVETEAQQHFLCKSQCDHLQGFLYGRPMPAEAISDLLGRGQLRHGQLCDTK